MGNRKCPICKNDVDTKVLIIMTYEYGGVYNLKIEQLNKLFLKYLLEGLCPICKSKFG